MKVERERMKAKYIERGRKIKVERDRKKTK